MTVHRHIDTGDGYKKTNVEAIRQTIGRGKRKDLDVHIDVEVNANGVKLKLLAYVRQADNVRVMPCDDGKVIEILPGKGIVLKEGIGKVKIQFPAAQRGGPFGKQGPQGVLHSGDKGPERRIERKQKATDRRTERKIADLIGNLLVEPIDTGPGSHGKVCLVAGGGIRSERNAVTAV